LWSSYLILLLISLAFHDEFVLTLVLSTNCCCSSFQDINRISTVVLVLDAGHIGGSTKS
jgi:hypothetical protein